jgi:multimeric flavodoxin WrbA
MQQDIQNLTPEPKVMGFSGSPRKGGNSDILLNRILNGVTENQIPADSLRLSDCRFQPCIGCERCRKDKICTGLMDGMSFLYPKIIQSTGLVLVSPTHNYNITAWMKAFIDRLYCFYKFDKQRPGPWSSRLANQGRKAIIAAVCEQNDKRDMGFTIEAMRMPLEALGYEIIGELSVLGTFARAKVKGQTSTLAKAAQLGVDLAKAIKNQLNA